MIVETKFCLDTFEALTKTFFAGYVFGGYITSKLWWKDILHVSYATAVIMFKSLSNTEMQI